MATQKAVGERYAVGIPGGVASLNPVAYTPVNYVAEENVKAGTFVWLGSSGGVKNSGSGAPLGFAQAVTGYPIYDVTADGTLVIPKGHGVTVALKGDFWATADDAITVGTEIKASGTTGAIDQTSGTATGWYARTAAADEGDLIIISSWA